MQARSKHSRQQELCRESDGMREAKEEWADPREENWEL